VKRKPASKKNSRLKLIPPTEADARDEGPRLIPLDERSKEPSRLEHYLELADTALGLSPSDSQAGRKRSNTARS
jgi:hypothetical protein